MTETVAATPRKDDAEPNGWGLWVDDFPGAEPGMCVQVEVCPRTGEAWADEALLQKRISGNDGAARWIARSVRKSSARQHDTSDGEDDPGHDTDASAPEPNGDRQSVRTFDKRSLPEIMQDVMDIPGLIPRFVNTQWVGDGWNIEIIFENARSLVESAHVSRADEPDRANSSF